MQITRLAPSPTGLLHLGNARTFLVNWLLARQNGWRIVLRIDDLDGPRVRPNADVQAIDDLKWLGFDWGDEPVYQSKRLAIYNGSIERLVRDGLAYPCTCTRTEALTASSAPHLEDGSFIYPGTCRGRYISVEDARARSGRDPSIRLRVPDRVITVRDAFRGEKRYAVERELGDFIIAKADGSPAYQLATVVDDADAGVTQVVRGDDLLDSTPRQILLYDALGMSEKIPSYTHVPLVVGTDGKRLAKRHGATKIDDFRREGRSPGDVLALVAGWCGIDDAADVRTASDLIGRFDLRRVPPSPIVYERHSESSAAT